MDLIVFDGGTVVPLELERAFSGNVHLSARQLAPDLIASQEELDALYLPLMAAERFGSRPILYEAQVLKSNQEAGWPEFIIAGIALKREDVRAGDPIEELKLTIEAVIDAVNSYNAKNGLSIRSVGFWSWDLAINRMDPGEAGKIIRAIYEKKCPE